MKRISLFCLMLLMLCGLSAQELDCKVSVNHSQIQGTSVSVFETFQKALEEFINQRHWTEAKYDMNERIKCTFAFTVKSYTEAEGRWGCDLIVQSNRPIYQSNYQSVIFSFKDPDVEFNYREFDQLEFQETSISSNLMAVVAYYAYLIIGLDMDTMAPMGGTDILRVSENIVNSAQTLNEKGWKAFDSSRNRYALINDYLDAGMASLRQLLYDYHRTGLDQMAINATRGRANVVTALGNLKKAHEDKPMSSLPGIFTEIKKDELVNIFGNASPAQTQEREQVYQILSTINPSLNSDWDKIKK